MRCVVVVVDVVVVVACVTFSKLSVRTSRVHNHVSEYRNRSSHQVHLKHREKKGSITIMDNTIYFMISLILYS